MNDISIKLGHLLGGMVWHSSSIRAANPAVQGSNVAAVKKKNFWRHNNCKELRVSLKNLGQWLWLSW